MICSINIYTRRPIRLRDTIRSVVDTVSDPANIEFILRYDSDDEHSIKNIEETKQMANVKTICGPPLGYKGYPLANWEMSQLAEGDWIWHFDDDATMDKCSKDWDVKLAEEPKEYMIVLPEVDRLGGSTYHRNSIHPFMWLPSRWWEKIGLKEFTESQQPFDRFIFGTLHGKHKWAIHYLSGVSTWHQRMQNDTLNLKQRRF